MIGAYRPAVIVISGSVGSGKMTLIRTLVENLGGAPTLIFDEYEQFAEWPAEIVLDGMQLMDKIAEEALERIKQIIEGCSAVKSVL